MDDGAEVKNAENSGSMVYVFLVCIVAAWGGLLFGYDTAVISGSIGFLQTCFDLDPTWKGWTVSSALAGCILGVAVAGILSDWLGRKKVLIVSAVLFLTSAIGTALPRNLTEFIIFRIIGGIGVGAASMTSPMYIAEIAPARIRGQMVSVYQFAIIFGMLVVYLVNYFIALQGDEAWGVQMGWRWMFGSESLPAVLFLILLFFVPESPRWLTQQNRHGEALSILCRVGGRQRGKEELTAIKGTITRESGSISQLFRPGMRIVLVIGVVLAVLQSATGIDAFLYYAPEMLKKLGAGTDTALLETVVIGVTSLIFTTIAIWTVDRLGRKPLMIVGAAGMCVSLLLGGLATYYQQSDVLVLGLILGYVGCFALSVGPVTWVIISEIFPTRIRGRAMGIATLCLWLANWIVAQTFPMMNENKYLIEKFHHGFPYSIYGVMCGVTVLFVWFFVPETKGKTLEEIEMYWKK